MTGNGHERRLWGKHFFFFFLGLGAQCPADPSQPQTPSCPELPSVCEPHETDFGGPLCPPPASSSHPPALPHLQRHPLVNSPWEARRKESLSVHHMAMFHTFTHVDLQSLRPDTTSVPLGMEVQGEAQMPLPQGGPQDRRLR